MNTLESIREDFILELMVFSPKYNRLISQAIADNLSEEQMKAAFERIKVINKVENQKLNALAENDPDAHDQRIKEKEREEEKIEELLAREYDGGNNITTDQINTLLKELEDVLNNYNYPKSSDIENKFEGTHGYITNLVNSIEEKDTTGTSKD